MSIIMPAYNHENYIEEAIRSVWNQSYPNIELIVVNDGSTDNTGPIIDKMLAQSPVRMKVYHKQNEGLCKTLNYALNHASGQYVSFLASDDRYVANHASRLVEEFKKHKSKSVGMVFGDVSIINQEGVSLGYTQFSKHKPESGYIFEDFLLFRTHPQGCANMYNLDILLDVGAFNEIYIDDTLDLYLRISKNHKCIYVDECLSEYRVTNNSENLNKKIAYNHDFLHQVFSEHIAGFSKHDDPEWVKFAWSRLYLKMAHNCYLLGDLPQCRSLLIKVVKLYPGQIEPFTLYIRTLIGVRLLSIIRKIKNSALRQL